MRQDQKRARIDLPPLTGEQAYLFVQLLERTIQAICRAHGDAMADFQGRVFPDAPKPLDAVWSVDSDGAEEIDF